MEPTELLPGRLLTLDQIPTAESSAPLTGRARRWASIRPWIGEKSMAIGGFFGGLGAVSLDVALQMFNDFTGGKIHSDTFDIGRTIAVGTLGLLVGIVAGEVAHIRDHQLHPYRR